MAASRVKLKPGELLEVNTPLGVSYLQYIGKHVEYGDVIRVLPEHYGSQFPDADDPDAEIGYVAFYPAHSAVAQGIVKPVGFQKLPPRPEIPVRLRRAGFRDRIGKVHTWIVEAPEGETVRIELSEDERKLPIAAVWDHELLIRRILQKWSPEQEI